MNTAATVAPVALLPQHIDSTMRTCYRSCPRKFFLEFCYGFRPPGVSIDLHAGGCLAVGLEEVYRSVWRMGLDLPDALLRAHAAFAMKWGDFEIPDWKRTNKTFERTWTAVEEYFKMWPPRTDPIQPYFDIHKSPSIEYSFAVPLTPIGVGPSSGFPAHPSGDPFIYTGRFDLLGQTFGRPIIKDDKTQGQNFTSDWTQKWSLRSQFMGYVWAARKCGIDVRDVAVRGIAIMKESIPLIEHTLPMSQTLIDRWHEQLRRDLWRIRTSWDEQYFDYDLGDACFHWNKPCIFHNGCESANPDAWHTDFEVRRWNPLEKNPID